MSMKNEALAFVEALKNLYLEQRDMDSLLQGIDEYTSWIGTGEAEICKNFSEATQALLSEKAECSMGFTIVDSWFEAQLLSPDVCLVFGEFWAQPKDFSADIAALHNRISAICNKTQEGMRLLHLHVSSPDNNQELGEYFVKQQTKMNNEELRKMVDETTKALHGRNQELEILTKNIPGGVHECANDPDFTLLNMSGGFLTMFGYTQEDIQTLFNNKFMNMIYEADQASVREIMQKQLTQGTTVEFEYRVKCKDGSLIWVLDRGRLVAAGDDNSSYFCLLIDITNRKEAQEELRLSLERHKVIMDQATDIIFEWDILNDTLTFSSNWDKKFGYPPITTGISKNIPLSINVHSEDMPAFIKIMMDTVAGAPYSETEFRIRNLDCCFTWCRIRATTQFDHDGCPIGAVGVVLDIDNEKKLLDEVQRDSLTKLYNKSATKTKITEYLSLQEPQQMQAMMIIDIDDFKQINDNFGHLCGDLVLTSIAEGIKKLFRATDVVGRIGGDEFLVFLPKVANRDFVIKKADELLKSLKEIPMDIDWTISCSIGIALCPQDGQTYSDLFVCADQALYHIKNNGKGGCAVSDEYLYSGLPSMVLQTAVNESIDSDETHTPDQELVKQIFSMLYNAVNIQTAINRILKIVGLTYDVSRAYVFESSEDGKYCSNAFEWCNEEIVPQMDNLTQLSYEEDLAGYLEALDESGIFYVQNVQTLQPNLRKILEPQGVVSVLQCAIRDGGEIMGFVGFDECRSNRYWTKAQVDSLVLVANILSTFLLKERQKEQILRLKEGALKGA